MNGQEFLTRIAGQTTGFMEIRPIPNLSGHDRWWITPQQLPDIEDRLEELDGESNIYFGVAPRAHFGQGSKDDCLPCRWVIADFDGRHLPESMVPAHASAWAVTHVREKGFPAPSIVVWSGRGIHVYWELDRELSVEEWERLHSALPLVLHSDPSVKNIDRLLRLPGYTNPKNDSQCELLEWQSFRYAPEPFFRVTNEVPSKDIREASTYRIEDSYTEFRNNGLYSEACRLHSSLCELPDLFLSTLMSINEKKCKPPLPKHEVAAILESVMRGRPLDDGVKRTEFGLSPIRDGASIFSDQDLCERVAGAIEDDVKHVRTGSGDDGRWISWSDEERIWVPGYAEGIVCRRLEELENQFEDIGNREMAKRTGKMHTVRGSGGFMRRLRSVNNGGLQISDNDLDTEDWMLVTADGTYLDLRTGEPVPVNRGMLITKKTRAVWRPDTKPSLWKRFLDRVMPHPHHQEYLGRVLFYCLTGGQGEKAFFISQGTGDNGKTVFWEVVMELMGPYAKKGNKKLICPSHATEAAHDGTLVACVGRRLAVYEEVKEQDRLSGDLLKELAGGNQWMAGRGVGSAESEFRFTAKQSILTNQFPTMNVSDPALLKRLIVIPWTETITREEIDPYMARKIVEHDLDGVLNWILSHREAFLELGLKPAPSEFEEKKEEFIAQSDPVVGFVRDRLEFSENDSIRTVDFKAEMREYAPSFQFPETRAVPQFMERIAVWCRSFMDKDRKEVRADHINNVGWCIRGVRVHQPGEEIV